MAFPFLLVIVLSPLAGLIAILALPKGRLLAIRSVALSASLIALVCSIYVFAAYDRVAGGMQFLQKITWVKTFGVSLTLGVDGISAPMVLLTAIVFLTAVLVSWSQEKKRVKQFFINLLFLVTGVFGVFSSLNLFFFFAFYELAVLPMFLLIGVWGSSAGRFTQEYGTWKLTLQLLGASVFVAFGIFSMWSLSGMGTFDIVALSQHEFPRSVQVAIFPILVLGFGTLAAIWPLHSWSPIGHATAPTAASMLHAGVLMKLGAYGLLRVGIGILPAGAAAWMPLVAVLATINIVYGALAAIAQTDFKFVIGYSSVSHMGLVTLGLATLNRVGIGGAVFQMFSHGIMTAAFFALVGIIYHQTHTRDIREFGGIATKIPIVAGIFVLAGLTSLGLPGTSGFVAEFLVFMGAFRTYRIIAVLAIIGSAITAAFILRVVRRVFYGTFNEKWAGLRDATAFEMIPLVILTGVQIFFGIHPGVLVSTINIGVKAIVARLGGGLL
jgi:NADH-quinone oxidoreductase subunit M